MLSFVPLKVDNHGRSRWIFIAGIAVVLLAAIPIFVAPLFANQIVSGIDGSADLTAAEEVAAQLNARRLMLDWAFRLGAAAAAIGAFSLFMRSTRNGEASISAARDQVEAGRYQVQAIHAQIEAHQKATEEQIRLTRSQLQINLAEVKRLNDQSQTQLVTDQYMQAVGQTGHPSVDVRVGGIHLLERIAKDHPEGYAETIYEVLVSSLREHTRPNPAVAMVVSELAEAHARKERLDEDLPAIEPVGSDVEAVLLVLARNRALFDAHVDRLKPGAGRGTGAHLVGLNLTSAWLRGVVLDNATLEDVVLTDARLVGTSFSESKLAKCSFAGASLVDCIFDAGHLDNCGFSWATINGSSFDKAQVDNCYFGDSTIVRTRFNSAKLTNIRFVFAKMTEASFEGTTIAEADFEKSEVSHTRFDHITMANADFHHATMTSTVFDSVNIADSDFSQAGFTDTRFEQATLSDVNFPDGFA